MVLASSLLALALTSAPAAEADLIYRGGPIVTINDSQPVAQAVAVSGGKIVAVGSDADVMKHKGSKTQVIELGGKALLPGFVDPHGHVVVGGIQALSANLLAPPDGEVIDIATLKKTLKDWVDKNSATVAKVKVIVGFGYDNAQLKELRHPTKEELDEVSKEYPVIIVHQSGHLATVNSKALEVLGIGAGTKDPSGGVIQRKPGTQEPNGVIEETAFFAAIPKLLANIGSDGLKEFVKAGSLLWARFGYTTGQEGRAVPPVAKVLAQVGDEGGLAIDVAAYADVLVDRDFILQNRRDTYKGRFRLAGAKLTIDGSPQGFTAWRDRPYYAPVGNYEPGYLGYPAATAKQVYEAVDWAYQNKIQIITHSNGEAASDQLIAAIGASQKKHGQVPLRPVLIHGQFLREDQVDSYVRLGVIPSLFPMHTFYWGDWHRDHTVGPDVAENISPTGWFRKRGSIFTSHHDAPVAFPDSMRVLSATVTRRSRSGDILGPSQRVDVMTALKAMTIWAAYQHFEEKTKGSIEVGKLADFVILSKNPLDVNPETLDQIKVTETIKEGKSVFKLAGGTASIDASRRFGEVFSRSMTRIAEGGHTHVNSTVDPLDARIQQNNPSANCACGFFSNIAGAMALGGTK